MLTMFLALAMAFESRLPLVPSALIVGRAVCADSTWLLTEKPELVEIFSGSHQATVRALRGVVGSDKPWGLACLADGTMWTLAAPRTLARIASGAIVERIALPMPHIALFGARTQLLVQQMPLAAGMPALALAAPRASNTTRAWPGLVARQAPTREKEIARNLVACGVSIDAALPCWFVDARAFVLSDGSSPRIVSADAALSAQADREAPIRDIARAGEHRYWVLESVMREHGVVGGRLSLVDERTNRVNSLELRPGARLIVSANATSCLLVSADGRLLEVMMRP